MCEMSVLEGLWGKNTDKEGIAGGRVNAQAFSLTYNVKTGEQFIILHIMWIGREDFINQSSLVHNL